MPNNEFQVLIQAIVDAKDVQTRLNAIKDLSVKIEKVNLDQSAIDSLRNQLNKNGIDVNLVLGNVNQIQGQATKVGQQIGKKLQTGVDSVIQKGNFDKIFKGTINGLNSAGKEAEEYFQKLLNVVSVQERLGERNNLESFVVSLKNANGIVEQLRYKLKENENDSWFEYAGGSINDNGVIKQFKAISTAADNLQITLNNLKSNYSDLNASKAIKDSEHISTLDQQYDKVLQSITNLRSADDSTFASMQTNVKSEIAALENMIQQFRNAEYSATSLRSKDISTIKIDEGNNLDTFVQKMEQSGHYTEDLKSKVLTLKTDLSNVFDSNSLTSYLNKLSNLQSEFKSVDAAAKTLEKSTKLQVNIDTGAYSTQITKLQHQLSKFGIQSGDSFLHAKASLKQLEAAYNDMRFSDNDKRLEHEKEYQKHLVTTKNLLAQIKSEKSNEILFSGDNRRISLIKDLNKFLYQNTAMTNQSKQTILEWINTLNSADDMTRGTFDNLRAQFESLEVKLRTTNKLGLSWTDKYKQAVEKFGGWAIATGSVMELWQQLRRIPGEVTKVNSSMTELYKVSDASSNEINNYFAEATNSAKKYGAAITDVINATADWSRLGYSLPDSKKLAEIAVLYKNVGDGIDISTASKSLVSTLQGFQLDADNALNIIDQFNEVANNFPINSAGIGEALQRSAASFYAANTDLSKSIALITGTNSVVQDPTAVGTMWKTVSMRIRGAKAELEAAGEDTEDMVESTAQLRDLIKGMTGFDIMKDEDSFKDIYDIIIGIGHEWKNLTDIEQASLLEKLAGKRQGNALSAALNNITMIEEAYDTATNAAGSAMKEQEKYEQSIQFSLDRLSASFQQFSNTALDSNFLKGIIDSGNTITNVLTEIIDKLGILGTLSVGASGIFGAKGLGLT